MTHVRCWWSLKDSKHEIKLLSVGRRVFWLILLVLLQCGRSLVQAARIGPEYH